MQSDHEARARHDLDATPEPESFAPLAGDQLTASLLANERQAARRLWLYVAAITAFAVAALALRYSSVPMAVAVRRSSLPLAVALTAAFAFGVSTLASLVELQLATDRYKFALRALRGRLESPDGVDRHRATATARRTGPAREHRLPVSAGALDVVLLLNTAILSFLTWTVTTALLGRWIALGTSLLAALIVLPWQLFYIARCYARQWKMLGNPD